MFDFRTVRYPDKDVVINMTGALADDVCWQKKKSFLKFDIFLQTLPAYQRVNVRVCKK